VGLDPNSETRDARSAPCAGSNVTQKEKITSLKDMVLVEENEDNTPSTDDEQSVVEIYTSTNSRKEIE
jgi:hypothetical protein